MMTNDDTNAPHHPWDLRRTQLNYGYSLNGVPVHLQDCSQESSEVRLGETVAYNSLNEHGSSLSIQM
jgi:hypothetical protein